MKRSIPKEFMVSMDKVNHKYTEANMQVDQSVRHFDCCPESEFEFFLGNRNRFWVMPPTIDIHFKYT